VGSAREKVQDASELMGMRDLQKFGGVEALIELIRSGSPRVKEAATAAIANAMEDSSETRNFFRKSLVSTHFLPILVWGASS
jgi:hypothetical protein